MFTGLARLDRHITSHVLSKRAQRGVEEKGDPREAGRAESLQSSWAYAVHFGHCPCIHAQVKDEALGFAGEETTVPVEEECNNDACRIQMEKNQMNIASLSSRVVHLMKKLQDLSKRSR
ncbi:hypothetical protein SKAU_G00098740 [Synaphobranchus kaupii]|uniref:Uncharacterized protein n=1 Tax=Synaphobranchus kaupii TaxID=118154 RepID=A0A9Q1FZ45_SYNKA|nr:hypothetical protein SKAU_G00098740 [Synaphobranchus kaupii]